MQSADAIEIRDGASSDSTSAILIEPCFHCGEPVPESFELFTEIDDVKRPMCCSGCQAVAEAIVQYGLGDYYLFREQKAHKPEQLIPEELQRLEAYDNPLLQNEYVKSQNIEHNSASFLLADMTCPACVWLIETRLRQTTGITNVDVNFSSHKASISWIPEQIQMSRILKIVNALGYKIQPYEANAASQQLDEEQKEQLRRLGVAGVLGIQVMMLSVALYVGEWSGIHENFRSFFSWLCWLLTTPVMLYSARSFFVRAWRDISLLQTGMDVPVALGLLIAYLSSSWATTTNNGQIYYDSIVMFVFFLLCGRYLEFRARRQSSQIMESIGQSLPVIATRKVGQGRDSELETIPVESLRRGDVVLVRSGDVIPTDGIVSEGDTSVNESLLTGESRAVSKGVGDFLIGGSSNIDQTVYMTVTKTGKDTVSSHIYRLMQQGQKQRPTLVAISNKVSAFFVLFVLILATGTAIYWISNDPAIWVPVTIATLVVTCPCALSLATPLALAAASTALMKKGLILVDSSALEILNKVDTVVFDKTGTLTAGELQITEVKMFSSFPMESCLSIARAMELNSLHPVAKAFQTTDPSSSEMYAENIRNFPGSGIAGFVGENEWYLGNRKFIKDKTGLQLVDDKSDLSMDKSTSEIVLANREQIHCCFYLTDVVREGAEETIRFLNINKLKHMILSGDALAPTRLLSAKVGIAEFHAEQSPTCKMSKITDMQKNGEIVAMVGDGANDVPVLATTNVSIAMGEGAALANTNAAVILLKGRLDKLITLIKTAKHSRSIIKQNMIWAIAYNITALPLAMTGNIEPWIAAIGMSLSSLLVVVNSGRLNQGD
ncbi:MAG: heavy metal translocating P-type ATPase [Gammaproteobacteria bacterium]|nr:heavy metal translocating P-type ATPase [Gammaproteobacteria bacterium]